MNFSYVMNALFVGGGCRLRFLLVYFGMQLNINSRKSVRNFAKAVVCYLSFFILLCLYGESQILLFQ
jgi:hypothetical protein